RRTHPGKVAGREAAVDGVARQPAEEPPGEVTAGGGEGRNRQVRTLADAGDELPPEVAGDLFERPGGIGEEEERRDTVAELGRLPPAPRSPRSDTHRQLQRHQRVVHAPLRVPAAEGPHPGRAAEPGRLDATSPRPFQKLFPPRSLQPPRADPDVSRGRLTDRQTGASPAPRFLLQPAQVAPHRPQVTLSPELPEARPVPRSSPVRTRRPFAAGQDV